MLLLELFCGTKSISKVAELNGIECITLDNEPKHKPDICIDILQWDYKNSGLQPDIIWASPPCFTWSLACNGRHRKKISEGLIPKTPQGIEANKQIMRLIDILIFFKPKYYFIENPQGLLRHFEPMKQFTRRTLQYGDYGHKCRKRTDIFTNCKEWEPREMTKKKFIKWSEFQKLSNNKYCFGNKYERIVNTAFIPEPLCKEIIQSIN